ncbi:Uncharacterised protein [Mycobacteroides abscessus]|nr:Uncharacterised protein [Mycobacteroides abscessus]
MRKRETHRVKNTHQVHVNHLLPSLRTDVGDRGDGAGDTRVRHDDVDSAESLDNGIHCFGE